MASALDWAYWHLARDTARRVLQGTDPVLKHISPGQLPPGKPARQVAMSILARLILRTVGRRPAGGLAPSDARRGCASRIIEANADPDAVESPDDWCQDVLTKIRDNLLVVQYRRRSGHQ